MGNQGLGRNSSRFWTKIKIMKSLKLLGIIACTLIYNTGFSQNGEWELEKNENGIKVYTRTVDGENIREFKATTTIEAPRRDIAYVIINVDDYANWYPDISEARIFEKVSTTEFHVYNVLDLPWPATDRDGVSKMKITKTAATTKISMESVNNVKDEKSDIIRITNSYGFWKLTTRGTKTDIHFQYFASPAGSLPDWIINMFIVDNPYETLKTLKEKFY